ncbi:MAG TPA: hypothetical protein VMD91_03630 [Candidatus Sulfotelmatobacter sp.]|nr:hypothetical protein [Candidatus Sulfotelmatobacter sp.]
MKRAPLRAASLAAIAALVPLGAFAVTKPFAGPTGWDHVVAATATPQTPRAQEIWKKSDGETLVYLEDQGLTYDDVIGLIHKNITDNAIHASVDRDRTCDARRAHEVEMTLGTTVVHQIVVDDAPGVTKLTYMHAQGAATSPEVLATLTAYCGG